MYVNMGACLRTQTTGNERTNATTCGRVCLSSDVEGETLSMELVQFGPTVMTENLEIIVKSNSYHQCSCTRY